MNKIESGDSVELRNARIVNQAMAWIEETAKKGVSASITIPEPDRIDAKDYLRAWMGSMYAEGDGWRR